MSAASTDTSRPRTSKRLVRPGGASPRLQVAEMQRTRLLSATVNVVDEVGYADVTVAHITARARISRRTFYELFGNRDECLTAVFEDALERVRREMGAAGAGELDWRERVRHGLWAILAFFDREPTLARVCLVQSARGSEETLERRAEVFSQLACVIDKGREAGSRAAEAPALTAEGLVGAAHAIVYERVLKRSGEPLTDLFVPLMSMILLPYLGVAAARREQSRSAPSPEVFDDNDAHGGSVGEADWLQGLPMRLTYRTIRVLHAIGERPGISNRSVGREAGVSDQGQISKLLARLERLGLIANRGVHVQGEANAWRLTPAGRKLTQNIHLYSPNNTQAA